MELGIRIIGGIKMELRYKYNITNRCDMCDNLESKLYEAIKIDDVWNEAIEEYEEVEIVDHEICICTKCGYEERI
ncbi:MAG: hypothetical protein J6D47_20850 [Peptostreptococcaceae bacterium]|nr:hypothetical protein [Peptostreptococcaceae bacterium]